MRIKVIIEFSDVERRRIGRPARVRPGLARRIDLIEFVENAVAAALAAAHAGHFDADVIMPETPRVPRQP